MSYGVIVAIPKPDQLLAIHVDLDIHEYFGIEILG